ncbi:MAG: IS1595 family transposase [Salinibacterium sp.]|nr:MAG: IS1595 family transposase [Salinibacterium sp.]
MDSDRKPRTLLEAIRYFGRPGVALEYMKGLRWPDGVSCPDCGACEGDVYFMASVERWKCRPCKRQFSVKVGTVMEDSPIKLDKWLAAIWLIANAKNGISSYEIHRALGVTQKTAWFLLHRIRLAMSDGGFVAPQFSGSAPVESDETFVGGKVKNMSKSKRAQLKAAGKNFERKAIVMGLLERGGEVRAGVVPDTTAATLGAVIEAHVPEGSQVFTDENPSYHGKFMSAFVHEYVNHVDEYVRGQVHTNGIENFWSLLKRCLNGTYISVEPFHLGAYVDEQVYRYNNRKKNDGQRFDKVLGRVAGKRLTYKGLVGAMEAER